MNTTKLSEEDVKLRYITPALNKSGWTPMDMRCEYSYTDGQIIVQGNLAHRRKGRRADYLLFAKDNYPLAVVEAKDEEHLPADGIQQAKRYAKDLNVQFAYSSNGEKFIEYEMKTAIQREIPMDQFPTKEELIARDKKLREITPEMEPVVDSEYYNDNEIYPPRYYQSFAVNKVIEAVAKGQEKIMLVMATGTGKTYTAFQIIWRLRKCGLKKRILYLADRNILIDQTMRKDFKPFRKVMTKIQGKTPEPGYEIYMSLYQQLVCTDSKEEDAGVLPSTKQPYEEFEKDFFDLIVIDECHRSSADEDKQYHAILDHFEGATKLGLTATPKAVEGANNFEYFGEPVYSYSLLQGIKDGFLAPYSLEKVFFNVDMTGYYVEDGEKDENGKLIQHEYFPSTSFGNSITINERQKLTALEITNMLKKLGRMTKTIVFCEDQEEAAIMRDLLIELNRDLCKKNPFYVVRITSNDREGKNKLDDFIDPYCPYPVIATTSELLTTGVDCKTCGLIAIDKNVSSMPTFKQMIGRGTRLQEDQHKLYFTILDFRDVTRKFFEPGFDADPETPGSQPEEDGNDKGNGGGKGGDHEPRECESKYHVKGSNIEVAIRQRLNLDANGKLITETITDLTKKNVLGQYPTLDAFRGAWCKANKKQAILDAIEDSELFIEYIRQQNPALAECDIFDILCHVAYDQKPLTRKERIEGVRKRNYLAKYEGKARQVLEALLDKYGEVGIRDIEDMQILNLDPFTQIGKRPLIVNRIFKGQDDYALQLGNLEEELYKEA